mmetsp:Transcript_62256/g.124794  ORF Transcript_62256/g.124794 Transcript_62256/m.124794 type:complete len:303 (+) Transcript_62256:54-962(+)
MAPSSRALIFLCLSSPFAVAWAPAGRSSAFSLSKRAPARKPATALRMASEMDGVKYSSQREEFCAIDDKTGEPIVLTVEEKERIFVDALQAYFYDGRELLNNLDFDQLKEDLLWQGSPVAVMGRDETKYLTAMQQYLAGKPIMSNEEFDALKQSLKSTGSVIAVNKEPQCFVDTGICKVTWTKDKVRQFVAYLPTAAVVSALWVIVAFELTPLRYINPLFGILLGSPVIYYGTLAFAENVFFKNPLVASGPCPDCNTENRVFFGDVLGVKGFGDEADLKCSNCKSKLSITRKTLRVSSAPKI